MLQAVLLLYIPTSSLSYISSSGRGCYFPTALGTSPITRWKLTGGRGFGGKTTGQTVESTIQLYPSTLCRHLFFLPPPLSPSNFSLISTPLFTFGATDTHFTYCRQVYPPALKSTLRTNPAIVLCHYTPFSFIISSNCLATILLVSLLICTSCPASSIS